MREKKYVVVGGTLASKSDGDSHFIGAMRLCELYKVDPDECYLFSGMSEMSQPWNIHRIQGLRLLRPRYDGNYTLTNPKQ